MSLLPLNEIGFVGRGRSRHRPRNAPHLYDGDYPFIQTADVKNAGLYITQYNQTYSDEGLAQSKLWRKGTLCITIAANIADAAILGIDACFPDSVIGFVPHQDKADVRYIKYYFDLFQRTFQQISQGAAQDNLSLEKLFSLKIPCPPIETQRKIAAILSAYDDLIENNLQRIKLLEEMAQITYEEWFVRMKFPGHETAQWDKETGLPDGWAKIPLGNMMIFHYGKGLRSHEKREGKVPIYSSAGVFGYHDVSLVDAPGIIVGRKGNVGSVFWSQEPFFPMDTTYYVESKESLYFAYFALKSVEFINNDAAVPGLNRNAAYAMKIISPISELIDRFEEKVKPTFITVFNLKKQNALLREAREILLPRLMTGVIDVDQVEVPEALLARVA